MGRTKPDYDFRSLTISITDDDENIKERKVYFLQYTGWPDFGVPTEASSFIDFYTEIQKQEEKLHVKKSKKRATSLYHCSAGIGRVGTFLAFESVLQLLQDSTPAQISIKDIEIILEKKDLEWYKLKNNICVFIKLLMNILLNKMVQKQDKEEEENLEWQRNQC